MIDEEIYPCTCPLCSAPAYVIERSDGNGGIIVDYAYDIRWLGGDDALFIEQGSDCPNTYHGGGE